jgi:uncharacterized protein (DUF1684 family)
VNATFISLFNMTPILFQTNTERTPRYLPFGKIAFSINNSPDTLIAYKSLDTKEEGLFIPFTDASNGKDTYETGRYLDIDIPKQEQFILDFNTCYNPYCAYSNKYSCPIPPKENSLNVSIDAGERVYQFHE